MAVFFVFYLRVFENPGTHDKSYTKLKFEPVAGGTMFCEILQHSRCWNSALENIFLTETISKAPPIEGWSFVTNFTGLFIGSWLDRSLITANAPFTSVWYYSIRKFMALPPTQACPSFPTSPKSFQIFWVISITNDGVCSSRKGERNHILAFSEFNRLVPLPLESINQAGVWLVLHSCIHLLILAVWSFRVKKNRYWINQWNLSFDI